MAAAAAVACTAAAFALAGADGGPVLAQLSTQGGPQPAANQAPTGGTAPAAVPDRPVLSLPLTCEPHRTCFIQSYVDADPTSGVGDYACGSASTPAHGGTDFRLLSLAAAAADVPVIASADGVIKGVRDEMPDELFVRRTATAATLASLKGRECGNGVVIDHGGGWETQYCHLKRGSVRVSLGQAVKRGERLGAVGYSGEASFAHVHLAVRHAGKEVDPFAPDASTTTCSREAKGPGLWDPQTAAAFPYRDGEIIGAGFATAPVLPATLERDHNVAAPADLTVPALVFFGRVANLRAGDRVRIAVTGPGGPLAETTSLTFTRPSPHYVAYAGKKRSGERWLPGRYEGRVDVLRAGGVIASVSRTLDLKP